MSRCNVEMGGIECDKSKPVEVAATMNIQRVIVVSGSSFIAVKDG